MAAGRAQPSGEPSPLESPSTALDGVADGADAGAGPYRPHLAAAIHQALGSQESRSLGGASLEVWRGVPGGTAHVALQMRHVAPGGTAHVAAGSGAAAWGGPTPAPSPAAGALSAPLDRTAAAAAAAAEQLAGLAMEQAPAEEEAQMGSQPPSQGWPEEVSGTDQDAAMAAVDELAQSLAD